FTDTLPTWASNLWNNNIKPFFTESIPNFLSNLWSQITSFVTETIPSIASSIAGTVTGWFGSIKDWIGNIFESIKSSFSLGYSDATSEHAWGGIMNVPHVGMVAEDGPEAIIPLSPSKSARGFDLWMKAGQQLGVKPYADGGIVGETTAITADTATASATAGGNTFEINMEVNPTFRIEGNESMDEEAIVAIIKARIKDMVDGIADELAERLARTFANMPVKGSA
ncbi:MAG: hypothetical protein LUD19_03445, partial [Clostridia bacterium]|nr:hypothetical protein [Clostridia bacterium]